MPVCRCALAQYLFCVLVCSLKKHLMLSVLSISLILVSVFDIYGGGGVAFKLKLNNVGHWFEKRKKEVET